jgi:transcriptional regulator GlxA family with amidase domain
MHRVAFVAIPNFGAMALAALSAFDFANLVEEKRVYKVTVLSEKGGPVRNPFISNWTFRLHT